MNLGAELYLEQAEEALTDAVGERRRSETSFLRRLLRGLGGDVAATGLSPAELFRSMLSKDPMHSGQGALEVLARPSQRLEGTLRPGDWILRAVPGTGDVGHISVLASDYLLTPYELESEGIDAESRQPGQYGLVIEAGAFPHCRSRPYARRILDSHGRVPPHALILRPSLAGSDIDTEDTKAPADNRKGITFSSESKISAAEMLKKINASKKLESWMKSVFSVKGNLLSRSATFAVPMGKTVPKWFQLFLNTALSNTTHVTTGEVRMDKDGVRLVGDFEPNDFPGTMATTGKGGQKTFIGFANIPDKYKDNVITLGFWHHEMVDEGAGWDGKNGLRSVERRVVVISNRQAFGKDTLGIDDEKILETFFHEVSAHQGVHDHIEFKEPKVSEKDRLERSQHSMLWVTTRTPDPTIDSDLVAKEVADFFGTTIDRTLYDKAKQASNVTKAGKATKAGSGTAGEALEPPPRQPLMPSRLPGQPTGPLQPGQPALPQQEIPRTVTVDLSANTPSTRAFRPERNDKSGVIELVAAVRYGSLIPANVTFRWRSEPPDAVGFGNQIQQPAQGPTNIRVPVFARRPGRARVFLEALNAQRQVIESSSITLSVPQFFVVTDSQLRDLPRITDNRQINQPATLDSALQQLGLLNDKEQIFSMVQGSVERIAGPRAAGTSNGCSRVHNVRFIWRLSAQPDAVPNGLPANRFTQVDLQGYPPVQLGTLFGNTAPAHRGAQNSAENPAELITVFAGMFELLTRENTTARDNTREEKDLRARLKTVGAYWRRNQSDACARAFMRTILSRAIANTICHEMYHSLLTIRADERGVAPQAFDPGGHLREPSILSVNRDLNARTGVRVTDEVHFPASRSYVVEETGIGPWQTLPARYHQRIWEFFPTPPHWPSVASGLGEDADLNGLEVDADQLVESPPVAVRKPNCVGGTWVINDESEFVPEVPKIMRQRGWTVAADFQDFWINGPANQLVGEQKDGKGTNRDIEVASIGMDWVLKFSRAKKHYDLMVSEAVYASDPARTLLRDRVVALHRKSGKAVISFGDLTKPHLGRETEYINQRALGSSTGGKGSYYSVDGFTIDELIAALGRFAMFVIPKGIARIKPPSVEIEITEVGVYVRDSFDFNGDQPLGAWKKPDQVDIIPNAEAQTPTCSDEWINMSNWAYRQYRKRTGKGRDFLIYSDIKTTAVKTSFTMPIKG